MEVSIVKKLADLQHTWYQPFRSLHDHASNTRYKRHHIGQILGWLALKMALAEWRCNSGFSLLKWRTRSSIIPSERISFRCAGWDIEQESTWPGMLKGMHLDMWSTRGTLDILTVGKLSYTYMHVCCSVPALYYGRNQNMQVVLVLYHWWWHVARFSFCQHLPCTPPQDHTYFQLEPCSCQPLAKIAWPNGITISSCFSTSRFAFPGFTNFCFFLHGPDLMQARPYF